MSIRRSGVRSADYATGLDGVRAIAVVAVLLYHAGLSWLPGGFAGVDLFFVVSGYLVTALLQREHDRKGRIDLVGFWQRRARRLLPALGLVLVVVSAGTLVAGRDLGAGLRWQILGALSFSSNWWQVGQQQSYVESMEPALLTHLWSLAVEEQFYLLWPFVAIFLLTVIRNRQWRVGLVLALAAASALAMAVGWTGGDPTRIYVGTDTHGFGLLLGAALAFARPDSAVDPVRGANRRRPMADVVGMICLVAVLAAFPLLSLSEGSTFRGGLFLLTVAATGLVAAAVRPTGPVQRLLSARWLRPVGLRSYSLYLWHWPALVVAWRVLTPTFGQVTATVVGIAAALVATEVTWRFVEVPVRRFGLRGAFRQLGRKLFRPRTRPLQRSAAWLGATCLAIVVVTAACGVVAAPTRSELELRLAAGQEALAEASRAPAPEVAAPVTTPTTSTPERPRVTVPSLVDPKLSRSPSPSPSPSGSTPTRATPTRATPTGATPTSATPTTPPPVRGMDIVALGDSVMLASAPALLSTLPGADIDAAVNRQLWDLPTLLDRPLRSHLVVGLGTNGTQSAEATLRSLALIPADTVVVLVNSAGPQEWRDENNSELLAVADQRPHTCVADWFSVIDGHDDHLAVDGIHPDETAGQWYADLVAQTLQTCS